MREFHRVLRVLLAVFGLWACAAQALGGSFVEHLSPPILSRGKTVRVTLVGSELRGATGLWTSLPATNVVATLVEPSREDRASFDVKVRPDAPLGLYGLRLATRGGLSNVKLFLIDDLRAVAERESLPGSAGPQHLSWPVAVVGRANTADVDRYAIEVAAGERISFEVVGSRLGQDFDPVVTIKDARGRVVVERDNDVGLMFDCRFAHLFEKAGTYTVEVHDTRFRGSDHLVYVLRVGRFPEGRVASPSTIRAGDALELSVPGNDGFTQRVAVPKDTAPGSYFQELRRTGDQASAWVPLEVSPYPNTLEHEPDDTPANASFAPIPSVLHGAIATPDDRDAFAVELAAGQRLTALFECRPLGSPADLDISLLDPGGKTINRLDTLPDGAANLEIEAKSKGRHVLLVRSLTGEGGPEYVYRITIALREPTVQLVADASSLAIPRFSHQPLPLSLSRTDFGGPIALELRGAPSGMALRTNVIRAGETEVDNAISVAGSVPEGLYSVQVVARLETGGRERTAIAMTLPLIDRLPTGRGPHGEPFELREDQRRLPPTLSDRIAILVTPPSPFTFELPDRSVLLPRYLEATFRLETTRVAGFDTPITFVARGGTLEPLNLQKPRVKAEMPPATRDRTTVAGVLRSGVNSELRKHRVTVTAHAGHEGRTVDLTRTFELRMQVAYEPSAEPQRLEIGAGESASVAIRANRVPPFTGPITIRPSGDGGWNLPAVVEIASAVDRAAMKIMVPPGTKPGVYRVALSGSARVSKFDEAVTGKPIEVVVVAPKGGRS
ncbi:MAG: hypothetical protein ACHRXM_19760 [Isosphaerales bacterium]